MRAQRLFAATADSSLSDSIATIYLGLYNAMPYLESLEEQLKGQKTDLPVVVVDNDSTDGTWETVQAWKAIFGRRLTLVKNPRNLGGAGSLYLNADLIKTAWFMTFHQDDLYLPHHASTLCSAIDTAQESTICITTEMGRLSPSGDILPTPARASWFMPDTTPATVFLTNLRLHNVPFPAAAFKTTTFFEIETPWHSTAFPDTEWVLSAAPNGTFEYVATETMKYRENPQSESHKLDREEKEIGATTALLRTFSRPGFRVLCQDVTGPNRDSFAHACLDGIDIRLSGVPELSNLVKLAAAEQMASAWGYEPTPASEYVSKFYASIGSLRVPEFLLNIAPMEAKREFETILKSSFHLPLVNIRHSDSEEQPKNTPLGKVGLLANVASALVPPRLKRRLAKTLSFVLRNRLRNSPWGYSWKE